MSLVVPISWLCLACGLVEMLLFSFGFSAFWWPGARVYALLLAGFLEPAALVSIAVGAVLLAYARWPAVAQTFPFLSLGRERELDSPLCVVLFTALALNLVALAGLAAAVAMDASGSSK